MSACSTYSVLHIVAYSPIFKEFVSQIKCATYCVLHFLLWNKLAYFCWRAKLFGILSEMGKQKYHSVQTMSVQTKDHVLSYIGCLFTFLLWFFITTKNMERVQLLHQRFKVLPLPSQFCQPMKRCYASLCWTSRKTFFSIILPFVFSVMHYAQKQNTLYSK